MAVYTQIDNPELYFQCKLYTGTGSEIAATLDGDEDMQPDLVAIKARTDAESHKVYDSVRGVTKHIEFDTTDAEATEAEGLKSFDSDGFTIGTYSSINASSSHNYVAWCWKESADAGFDIITYSGTGSAKNESHSLSATPHWILTESTSHSQAWATHHRSYSATEKVMYFDRTNALASTDPDWLTAVSSSTISLGGSGSDANTSGRTYVNYLWSEKQGFSKFGSYTGNGNADGTFVFCGFRPAFVICKRTDSSDNWMMVDNKRGSINLIDEVIFSDLDQEEVETNACDFLSNGFKAKTTSTWINASGGTYIYMAFAEQPFVNSNGVPCNAR